MMHFYKFLIAISVFFIAQSGFSQIVINEYSCANTSTVLDSYGENEDWIELFNTTGAPVDLNGYHLSDKFGNITKFEIPSSIVVPANGYLMIFCNGRRTINGGQIHTNFKLTQTQNEKIILTNAGVVVDSLTIVPTQSNHSRGRSTDGAATWGLFSSPTPNGSNSGVLSEYATTPIFSVAPGFYAAAQSVSISTPDPNVTIHYTIDGSEPTTTSAVYTAPINVAITTVVRAKCYSSTPGIPASFVETNTYFINSTHTVPVISICGDQIATLMGGSQIDPMGSLEFFDRAGVMQSEVTGDFNKHGNDSWAYDQRGIDFIARDQYGYNHAIEHQIFAHKSRDEFQRLILKAGASDNYPEETGGMHLRDAYVQTLSHIGDLHLDERTYDASILYVNGEYWGVYESREKVDDPDFLDYYYGQDELWKDSDENIQYLARWGGLSIEYGGPNAATDWTTLLNYITTNSMAVQANFNYVTSQYKWKSLVDYFVLNSYIVNQDMLNWNTSWWRGLDTNGSKLKWRYSLWDMDAVFGHYINFTGIPDTSPDADPCNIDNLPDPGGDGHTVILNALMDNPGFEQYYVSRYIDLSNTTFKCDHMIAVLDSMVAIIAPEMPGQVAKWGGSMAGWQQNVQDVRDFINARCVAINQGLEDCYDVVGPYPMVYNVFPAGAGDVQINSINPVAYPFSGSYFGDIDILLTATPNTGYFFDHWEVFNSTLDSAITNPNNVLRITQGDSVVAHFILIGDTVELTFDVDPVGSGDVSINSFTPAAYSYSSFYPETSVLNLVATPAAGSIFLGWTSNLTPFTPISTDPNVTITVDQADTIVAHFEQVDTFSVNFNVSLPGTGNISIDGFTPASYVYTESFVENTMVNLSATPNPGYVFINWTSTNGTPFVSSSVNSNVSVTITQAENIVANFALIEFFNINFKVTPVSMGEIEIDSNSVFHDLTTTSVTKSYMIGTSVDLIETPISNLLFDHWGADFHTLLPSTSSSTVSFIVGGHDTIVAYYLPEVIPPPKTAQIPGAFSPNGDGNNDMLYIYGGQIEDVEFDIYDRWGEKVFSSTLPTKGWDGNHNGKPVPSGVYMFKLKAVFADGDVKETSGDITLVR